MKDSPPENFRYEALSRMINDPDNDPTTWNFSPAPITLSTASAGEIQYTIKNSDEDITLDNYKFKLRVKFPFNPTRLTSKNQLMDY